MAGRGGSGAGMVEGALWKKWLYFYIPLTLFVVGTLFPFYWMLITAFRPDAELYRPWRAVNNTPFWTTHPTWEHVTYLFRETMFGTWLYNTMFIAIVSTLISIFCGLLAGYALARLRFPLAGPLGTRIFVTYLVPPTLLFIPLADIIRNFRLGDTPWSLILTYPTFLIPFCTWLLMGYFKTIPKELEECARIDGASRDPGHGPDRLPDRHARHPVGGHLRVHAVVERVHLRARLPLVAPAEDRAGGGGVGADPGRRLLLGSAHGRARCSARSPWP